MELILAFVAGLIVMDLLWAYKTGVLQYVLYRIRNLFRKGA
jgi:hypothetical protein